MRAGQLDRQILIMTPPDPEDVNDLGEPAADWTLVATVWAEFRPQSGREIQRPGKTVAEAVDVFVIRYRADVNTAMKVILGPDHYQIQRVAEVGRRQGLELTCRKVN